MKNFAFAIVIAMCFATFPAQITFGQSAPYTPATGSKERKAILDGVRKYRKAPTELYTPTKFKVQNGCALVSAEDPSEPGVDSLAFTLLLRKTGNTWRVVDSVGGDEGFDWNAEIKRIKKKFPRCPAAIFD